jgi:hypothetical protein
LGLLNNSVKDYNVEARESIKQVDKSIKLFYDKQNRDKLTKLYN